MNDHHQVFNMMHNVLMTERALSGAKTALCVIDAVDLFRRFLLCVITVPFLLPFGFHKCCMDSV